MKGMAGIAIVVAFLIVMGAVGWYATSGGSNFIANIAASLTGITASLTPGEQIFCNEYNYIGCVENPVPTSYPLNGFYQCPSTASRCVSSSSHDSINVCGSCALGGCSNCRSGSVAQPGQYFFQSFCYGANCPSGVNIQVYSKQLSWCGKSVCAFSSTISKVSGTSGCSFVPSQLGIGDKIYDESGRIVTGYTPSQIYTIPLGTSYQYTSYALRRVCGSTSESCNADTDCTSRYPYSINYNGQRLGATFVDGRVTVYGCKKTVNECIEKTILASGAETCTKYNEKSYCDAIGGTSNNIQCIPDSSTCAPGLVCKEVSANSYACVPGEQKECTYDWQCGGGETFCSNKQLQTPKCTLGRCTATSQAVECCGDRDCPGYPSWGCGMNNKCYEKPKEKNACPYQCCINDERYINQECAPGKTCCGNGECADSATGCSGKGGARSASIWDRIIGFLWLWLIGSIIGAILLVAASIFIPLPFIGKNLFANPKRLIIFSLLFGLLLATLFTPFTASVASMVTAA